MWTLFKRMHVEVLEVSSAQGDQMPSRSEIRLWSDRYSLLGDVELKFRGSIRADLTLHRDAVAVGFGLIRDTRKRLRLPFAFHLQGDSQRHGRCIVWSDVRECGVGPGRGKREIDSPHSIVATGGMQVREGRQIVPHDDQVKLTLMLDPIRTWPAIRPDDVEGPGDGLTRSKRRYVGAQRVTRCRVVLIHVESAYRRVLWRD